MNPNTLNDILHWLATFAIKDENQRVAPNTFEGQVDRYDQMNQVKEEELGLFIRQQMPSFKA